ncbi:MAG: endo alpha-1,4 polygalactosaminidase [Leucothrix sp.]
MLQHINSFLWAVLLFITFTTASSAKVDSRKSTAVYYGPNLPTDVLSQYSRIIVEADNVKPHELTKLKALGSDVFAYLSIGEVSPTRKWFNKIQPEWVLGDNRIWDSKVMDINSPGWQNFLINTIVTPLWEAGYRGLFIDTMDSFKLFANSDAQRQQQTKALASLMQQIHQLYPKMRFIANRGFEVLPAIGHLLEAVAAESLFASWDNGLKQYTTTKQADQQWLLNELHTIKQQLPVDIIIIDYMAPSDRDNAEKLANRISNEGFIPWISIPSLDMVGVSQFKPKLNTYLLLTDSKKDTHQPLVLDKYKTIQSRLANKGFALDVHDIQLGMPSGHLIGRYLGIVTAQPYRQQFAIYKNWLHRQQREGIKIHPTNPQAAIHSM